MIIYFFEQILKIFNELSEAYESFKCKEIYTNRFTQTDLYRWLRPLDVNNLFDRNIVGFTAEEREIALYTYGKGATKVLLWSQMHGDEPTATMALCDILHFFAKEKNNLVAQKIKEELTLLILPMLNPDGAERFTRRNAQFIDINRDALTLETPEARLLKEVHSKYKPEYGFNLHDQDTRLTVGLSKNITAIALLAPSIDEKRSDSLVRIKAKKTASLMFEILNQFIPGYIAKWDDTYEPRAFGDNLQKCGTSTVLIESGGWKNDPEKFFLRKLNCVLLISTFYAIADNKIDYVNIDSYEQIPFNTKLGCDYLIRNATIRENGKIPAVKVDVAINYEKKFNNFTGKFEDFAVIIDIGDLSSFAALSKEEDAAGAELNTDLLILDAPFPIEKLNLLIKKKI